jgi:type I restriction enzyme, R subunit
MNQNKEQQARDLIENKLTASGWILQGKKSFNLAAGIGVAIREFQTSIGPLDYVLFVNRQPVCLVEAKWKEEGVRLTMAEDQSIEFATSKLEGVNNDLGTLYI